MFDRDSFPPQNFNRALQLAANENIKVAYSNEAFELWYLLHFDYLDTPTDRHRLCEQLSDRLQRHCGALYQKNSIEMYGLLLDRQDAAIRNAHKLFKQYPDSNPEQNNPSTTVHRLVEELRKDQ